MPDTPTVITRGGVTARCWGFADPDTLLSPTARVGTWLLVSLHFVQMAATLDYNGSLMATGMVSRRAKFDGYAEVSRLTQTSAATAGVALTSCVRYVEYAYV